MRVVVVGGAGFLGSHIVEKLHDAEHAVVVLDQQKPKQLPGQAEYWPGSMEDEVALTTALYGADAVIHLAAVSNTQKALEDPVGCFAVNVMGTMKVLEAAKTMHVEHVILAGSSLISDALLSGDEFAGTVDESDPMDLNRITHPYVASKVGLELVGRVYQESYGLDVTTFRYGILYGPRMTPGVVVHNFITNALIGKPLRVDGSGEQWRQYLYVEDVADAHVLAVENREKCSGRTLALVGGEEIAIGRLAKVIAGLVPGAVIEHGLPREGDIAVKFCDQGAAESILGWRATTALEDGLRKTVSWYSDEMAKGAVVD